MSPGQELDHDVLQNLCPIIEPHVFYNVGGI